MDDCQSVKQKRAKRRSNLPNFQLIRTGRFIECEDDSKIFFLESTIKNPKANIIIVTPFGKTIHDMFLITFYLNYNGFNVYRFDPRDHVGMSFSGIPMKRAFRLPPLLLILPKNSLTMTLLICPKISGINQSNSYSFLLHYDIYKLTGY